MQINREEQLKIELEFWSEEFPEKWRKDCRVKYLELKVLEAYDRMIEKWQELNEKPIVWKYFLPMCEGRNNFEKYYLSDLIKAWGFHVFYGVAPISEIDLLALIRQKQKNDYRQAKSAYVSAYVRLGVFKGTITFDNGFDEATIERAKAVRIDRLIENGNPKPGGNGRLLFLCPFHQEKTPSFVLYADNSFYCFGCNVHGSNAINFIMKRDSLKFKEAIAYLNQYG